jgi:membrane protease YdiL (CAAX protease family)
VVCLPLIILLRIWRPEKAIGPERLDPDRPAFGLAVALMMGFCAYFFMAALYGGWKHIGAIGPDHKLIEPNLGDSVFLYSVPPLAGAAMIFLTDLMIGGSVLVRRLGLDPSKLSAGMRQGAIAAAVVIPLTYLVAMLSQMLYLHLQYQHPPEHDLLKILTEPTPAPHPFAHVMLVISATVVAPFCEEFMFRGHLQTVIRRALIVISTPLQRPQPQFRMLPAGYSPQTIADAAPAMPVPSPIPVAPIAPLRPPVWQTWLAIAFTSVLFAIAHWDAHSPHPLWMAPPIFCLSLGLGYCYERTGNLWSNMLVHCIFNSVSTFVYLSSVQT